MRSIVSIFALMMVLIISPSYAADTFEDGQEAYTKRDWFNAIRILRPLAEQGNDNALVILGNMYSDGSGVKQDQKVALDHYKRAAAKGNTTAMTSIATMYAQGIGVEKDFKKSYDLFVKAANLGNPAAQIMVASIYVKGHPDLPDLKADPMRSYAMFRVVERTAEKEQYKKVAEQFAKRLISELDTEQVLQAEEIAKNWKPKDNFANPNETETSQTQGE